MAICYYNAKKVERIGRRIQGKWDGTQPPIPKDHRLLAVMEGTRTLCPDVTDPDEYNGFYAQYKQGYWRRLKLFLVRESSLVACTQ